MAESRQSLDSTCTVNFKSDQNPDEFANKQVRVMVLNCGQHLDSTLFNLEKGWILEFQLGSTLFGKDICLYTNHPPSADVEFDRKIFYSLEWLTRGEETCKYKMKDSGLYAQLTINRAGSFKYYFIDKEVMSAEVLGSGYFTVNPVLSFELDNKNILELNSIQCQTVLTKCLGCFDEWEDRLRVSKESGYNMIHFTPVQELGGSRSSYCIKDQLKLNPDFSSERISPTLDDVGKLINMMQHDWKVLSISDVVLNHTANESSWLLEHPESTYNMLTAPHLIPAAILDGYLSVFSKNVAKGKLSDKGIPNVINTEEHLRAIKYYLEVDLIPSIRLHEYFTCDIHKLSCQFMELIQNVEPTRKDVNLDDLKLINDSFRGRNEAIVDMQLALNIFNTKRSGTVDEGGRISKCVEDFENHLRQMNSQITNVINDHLAAAICNCIANIRYHRVQLDGPRISEISDKYPLLDRYFTGEYVDYESVEKEIIEHGQYVMAHNGWVMDYDPLKNFAAKDSNIYLRRELIAWGDSVKLRYGESYNDCPFLWDHMRKYVEETVRIFHGIRLDNCHSTPLPVAEFLLDCARKVRADLYVVAELFTNSNETDNIFINRLGITSLIRESMSAWNCSDLGRIVHRYGGDPVGSFRFPSVRPLIPRMAHALFYDVTHDNESLIEKKSVFDVLPTSALVNIACCASGSTRGFDELVPHNINVVNEERRYMSWSNSEIPPPGCINSKTGIIAVKARLNALHRRLNDEGYSEIYVDQMNENIVAVTRHNPCTHDSIIILAYTAFTYPKNDPEIQPQIKDLKLEGVITDILLEAYTESTGQGDRFIKPQNIPRDENYINGLLEYKVKMRENLTVGESVMLKPKLSESFEFSLYELVNFIPGSIIVVRMRLKEIVLPKINFIMALTKSLFEQRCDAVTEILKRLSLGDLNFALYRCSEEDAEDGYSSYNVPGYGHLVYCGLQGFSSVLNDIRSNNDLGHPLCHNLRQGNWMMDYITRRFKMNVRTKELGSWFQETFENLKCLPRYLIPLYFDVIITSVTNRLLSTAAFKMSEFVRTGSYFVRALAMGSVQCVGSQISTCMPLSPKLPLKDPNIAALTISAGLPYFSVGYMRSWGRDTFISLRGLLLITGRYQEARYHILGYAGCLRHGLIPNLLGCGNHARFNCRDAVWWWLYAIMSYIRIVPKGYEILNDPVARIFPDDNPEPVAPGNFDQPLCHVIQEALTVHFQGVEYRERNAGHSLDENMSSAGFNNKIGVDLTTGFVFGGNEYNCGTWMDKMGSSDIAGNRGRPATPRDGSAVELVGLSKAVLRDLDDLYIKNLYPFDGVTRTTQNGEVMKWTFKEWEEKVSVNFEKYFWVDYNSEHCNPNLIHRRDIYKDCYGATQPWADYQLRCNFPIALTVAPEMADPDRAWKAIQKAEEILLGPMGIKTLDPADWNYAGNYNNGDNSSDPKVARGFNYHQGPEWLWPVGYFLRAKLHFARLRGSEELRKALSQTRSYLGKFYHHLTTSHWRGLPELTQMNGGFCADSCPVQAWSIACILEVVYDIENLEM